MILAQKDALVTLKGSYIQWRNRRRGGGQGEECPCDFWPEIFCWPTGKEEARKKGKRRRKRKIVKGKVENWKWKEGKLPNEERTFFSFSFLGLPKLKFTTGKKHFTPGKKSGKMTLPPQKNYPVTPLLIFEHNIYFLAKMLTYNPIRVVEQGNYHVIVVTECSGVQHPMISMLFIP